MENKYHFAREVIFNLRSCHAIDEKVYLHWIDKLNEDEKTDKNMPETALQTAIELLEVTTEYEVMDSCKEKVNELKKQLK